MNRRLRVVRWVVQPVVLADDGDELIELDVSPITVANAHWERFAAEGWREAVDELRRQVEGDIAETQPGA